jgi:hypothetical protein
MKPSENAEALVDLLVIATNRCLEQNTELETLRAENARLREALEAVIKDLEDRAKYHPDPDCRDIVAIGDGAYTKAMKALAGESK